MMIKKKGEKSLSDFHFLGKGKKENRTGLEQGGKSLVV